MIPTKDSLEALKVANSPLDVLPADFAPVMQAFVMSLTRTLNMNLPAILQLAEEFATALAVVAQDQNIKPQLIHEAQTQGMQRVIETAFTAQEIANNRFAKRS